MLLAALTSLPPLLTYSLPHTPTRSRHMLWDRTSYEAHSDLIDVFVPFEQYLFLLYKKEAFTFLISVSFPESYFEHI